MDILKKLMFWKKDDLGIKGADRAGLPDANIGLEPNLGLGQPGFAQPTTSQPSYPSFQTTPTTALGPQPQAFQSMQQEQQSYTLAKEIELISTKIDALRAVVDNLNQRLASLEKLAYSEYQQSQQSQQTYMEMPQRPY